MAGYLAEHIVAESVLTEHLGATMIARAIRTEAHCLTLEERTRLAVELLTPHSTDHARDHHHDPTERTPAS